MSSDTRWLWLVVARFAVLNGIHAGAWFPLAAPLLVLGFDPHVLPLVLGAFVAGAGVEVFAIGWSVAMQENVEEQLLSRAYSCDALGSCVAIPVGQVLFGPLGKAFGYRDVLVASGAVYVLAVIAVLCSRSVRDLRREPQRSLTG